ncbi:MAG: hypothetical protein FGM15_03535 [Chthoniobacterales bacterium]|nr:hypothetical protein [Chthoniobacterales bacterium]
MSVTRKFFRSAAVAALVACAATHRADAELAPPPQGRDVTVEVMRGGRVTIPLEAFSRTMSPVTFGIDPERRPRHGRLGEIRTLKGKLNKATVVYTHGDDEQSMSDEFYFTSRKNSGGGASRAKVTIFVVDPPPVLAARAVLDFGEIVMGESPILTLPLANVGGGRLGIELRIPEPFRLETAAAFQLGRGKQADAAISFAPTKPGDYLSQFQPAPSDPGIKVTLRGRAIAPIEVSAVDNVLKPSADGSRSAEVNLLNRSAYPVEAEIALPADIPVRSFISTSAIERIEIEPGQTATATLRISPEQKGPLENFSVEFRTLSTAGEYSTSLEFSAPAVPPRLEIAETPDFGVLKEGRTAKSRLVVKNSGGAAADFRVKAQPPLRIADKQETFTVPPGGSVPVELTARLTTTNEVLPPNIVVALNGSLTNVPVRFSVPPFESPTPTPAPPTAHPWILNSEEGVQLALEGQQLMLRWVVEKPGWKDPAAEIYRGNAWQRYEAAPPPDPGFWSKLVEWFRSIPGKIRRVLAPLGDDRTDIEKLGGASSDRATPGPKTQIAIAPQDASDRALWRLTAVSESSGTREQASEYFHLDPAAKKLIPAEAPPQPSLTNAVRLPELQLRGARAKSERRKAHLALVVPYDTATNPEPQISDYELEQVALRYSPSGMQSETVKTDATAKTVELVRAADTNLVEVRAVIDGLAPGTRTFWRLKRTRASEEPQLTGEISVVTAPPLSFPWRWLFIGGASLALAVIFYLRHMRNRAY